MDRDILHYEYRYPVALFLFPERTYADHPLDKLF